MWFMNKFVNPLMRMILRSPLQSWFGQGLLLLTYHGRMSGKEYSLPVQYVQDGPKLYIVPGMAEQKTWWRNMQGGLPVQVTLQGTTLPGRAVLLKQESEQEAIAGGLALYLQRFPSLAKTYRVRVGADGSFDDGDINQAATATRMVCVHLN